MGRNYEVAGIHAMCCKVEIEGAVIYDLVVKQATPRLFIMAAQSANLSIRTNVSAFLNSSIEDTSEMANSVMQWSTNRGGK
jgi:hypothetical protein